MKKLKSVLVTVFAALCLFGCKNEVSPTTEDIKTREISFEDTESVIKDEMLFYTVAENYKLAEEEVYNDLTSFLALKIADSDENTDYGRALSVVKNQYEITKIKGFKKDLSNNNIFARGVESNDEVNFSIYDISNPVDGTKGVAVTSDDERVGSLLCILDDIDCTDTEEDPVLEIFMEHLDCYVENVSNEIETITEKDLELFKEKYNITDEEIAAAKLEYENSLESRKFFGYDSWSSWSIIDVNLNNFSAKTKWNQNFPYNDAIKAMEGDYYYTGCTTTAFAQIMAYHEYPSKYTRSDLTTLKTKWKLASNWDGVYDWKAMTSKPSINNLSKNGRVCVGALMYNISKEINAKYSLEGTKASIANGLSFIGKNGYSYSNKQSYSFSAITSSLRKDCPVIIEGYKDDNRGHAWVIDGSLELQRTRNYYAFWIPFKCKENQDYVHCNYGWSGNHDEGTSYSYRGAGYYKSGVFVAGNNNYKNFISIYTNIRPNR